MTSGTHFSVAVSFMMLLATGSGCTHDIGDACMVNSDCSPLGNRYCDTASPGGYCTVLGCDYLAGQTVSTCPGGVDCVSFYTLLRTPQNLCNPLVQGRSATECKAGDPSCCVFGTPPTATAPGCCTVSQICLEDTSPDPLHPIGYCAEQTSERRYCMAPCNSNGDCRQGYLCYTTFPAGANPPPDTAILLPGALAVPYVDTDGGVHDQDERFCAPAPMSIDMNITDVNGT